MTKGPVRPSAADGLCEMIDAFLAARQSTVRAVGQVLCARGVRTEEAIAALAGTCGADEAAAEVAQKAAMAGASDAALAFHHQQASHDTLAAGRLHEIIRALGPEIVDAIQGLPLMAEEYTIPTTVRRWGRIRGMMERWMTAPGRALSDTQTEKLDTALSGLGKAGCHVHLWTDEHGKPQIEYWSTTARSVA